MPEALVKSRIENGGAEVVLNWPEALNAFTPDLLTDTMDRLKEFPSD